MADNADLALNVGYNPFAGFGYHSIPGLIPQAQAGAAPRLAYLPTAVQAARNLPAPQANPFTPGPPSPPPMAPAGPPPTPGPSSPPPIPSAAPAAPTATPAPVTAPSPVPGLPGLPATLPPPPRMSIPNVFAPIPFQGPTPPPQRPARINPYFA